MKTLRRLVWLAVWLWGPAGTHGQEPAGAHGREQASCGLLSPSWCGLSAEQAEFLLAGRRAARSYKSPEAAVADGFRPVGADAAAMGRHWVSLARLFDGEIDPLRPEILMYAAVEGRETLVGIGFAYVARSGESRAPPPNPFEPDAWHAHSGRIDMESHRTDHQGGGLQGAGPVVHGRGETGVSVLHAWVLVENPRGVIEPNNWALPYVRLGLSRPDGATPEADRAISLASLGAEFLIDRAELFADSDSGPESGWTAALRGAETEVGAWWRDRSAGALSPEEIEWLGAVWRRFGLVGL